MSFAIDFCMEISTEVVVARLMNIPSTTVWLHCIHILVVGIFGLLLAFFYKEKIIFVCVQLYIQRIDV